MRRHNPNVIDIDPSRYVSELAEQHGLETARDASDIFKQLEGVAVQDLQVTHSGSQHIERDGARYVFTQYDYTNTEEGVVGNRMLAAIRPGDRTELAYWTAAARDKLLTVHRGIGTLVVGSRSKSEVELIPLDADGTTEVTLPARSFYCLEADGDASGLLIISGLYVPPVKDWEAVEIEVKPGQEFINSQKEGMIRVPDGYRERYEP